MDVMQGFRILAEKKIIELPEEEEKMAAIKREMKVMLGFNYSSLHLLLCKQQAMPLFLHSISVRESFPVGTHGATRSSI